MLTLGQGDVGQLGLGVNVMERKKPALVPLPEMIVQAEAGGMHTVCLSQMGKVSVAWGEQHRGEREGTAGSGTGDQNRTLLCPDLQFTPALAMSVVSIPWTTTF